MFRAQVMPRTNTRLGQAQEDMENGGTVSSRTFRTLTHGFRFLPAPVCFDHAPSFCSVPPFPHLSNGRDNYHAYLS